MQNERNPRKENKGHLESKPVNRVAHYGQRLNAILRAERGELLDEAKHGRKACLHQRGHHELSQRSRCRRHFRKRCIEECDLLER